MCSGTPRSRPRTHTGKDPTAGSSREGTTLAEGATGQFAGAGPKRGIGVGPGTDCGGRPTLLSTPPVRIMSKSGSPIRMNLRVTVPPRLIVQLQWRADELTRGDTPAVFAVLAGVSPRTLGRLGRSAGQLAGEHDIVAEVAVVVAEVDIPDHSSCRQLMAELPYTTGAAQLCVVPIVWPGIVRDVEPVVAEAWATRLRFAAPVAIERLEQGCVGTTWSDQSKRDAHRLGRTTLRPRLGLRCRDQARCRRGMCRCCWSWERGDHEAERHCSACDNPAPQEAFSQEHAAGATAQAGGSAA